jgi:hypothetical protein
LRADAELRAGGRSKSPAGRSCDCIRQAHNHQKDGVHLIAQEPFGFKQFRWREELFKQNIREALPPEVLAPSGAAED